MSRENCTGRHAKLPNIGW